MKRLSQWAQGQGISDGNLFGLDGEGAIYGFPGGTVATLERNFELLTRGNPGVVFLQIGGNDLRIPVTGKQVASRLIEFAGRLRRAGVARAVIGQLLPREEIKQMDRVNYTVKEYEAERNKVNISLSLLSLYTTPQKDRSISL